jgi:hypothetical protein
MGKTMRCAVESGISAILGVSLAWFLLVFLCQDKPPAVIPGTPVAVVDTVIIHDTVRVSIPRDKIVVRVVPAAETDTTLAEEAVCYGVENALESGGVIGAEVCSRVFPKEKPEDIKFNLFYKPGNDTIRSFLRIDTIPKIIYKKPVISPWTALIVGVAAGSIAAVWIAHK